MCSFRKYSNQHVSHQKLLLHSKSGDHLLTLSFWSLMWTVMKLICMYMFNALSCCDIIAGLSFFRKSANIKPGKLSCSVVNTQLVCSVAPLLLSCITKTVRNLLLYPNALGLWFKPLYFNNGIPNHVCTLPLNCLCRISSPINSPMHTKAKLSKIILQNNAVQEDSGPRESLPNWQMFGSQRRHGLLWADCGVDNLSQANRFSLHFHQLATDHQPARFPPLTAHMCRWRFKKKAHSWV